MPIVGFYNCCMFSCELVCVHSSFAIILIGEKRAGCFALFVFLVAGGCFVALPGGCQEFVCIYDYGIS